MLTLKLLQKNIRSLSLVGAICILLFTCATPGLAQSKSRKNDSKLPKPLTEYMGRSIARTMHYSGAEWLIRDEREREERCSMVLANLGLKPGMTVCDMGCGNGFYAIPIAKLLGSTGQVLAVDIQPQMLGFLRDRIENEGVENVTPILGSVNSPRLPENSVDILLMVDVYHEFSYPQEMLAGIHRSMKADGLVVLVEYRAEDDSVPIKPEHKMTQEQVDLEMQANGFTRVKSFDRLPWQHMLFYNKTASDPPKIE